MNFIWLFFEDTRFNLGVLVSPLLSNTPYLPPFPGILTFFCKNNFTRKRRKRGENRAMCKNKTARRALFSKFGVRSATSSRNS